MEKIRVTTEKKRNGKWQVRCVEADSFYAEHDEVLDSSSPIEEANFVPVTRAGEGFSSRELARQYLRAFKADMRDLEVIGGLH